MDDHDKIWPPPPSAPTPVDESQTLQKPKAALPHLAAILVMWGVTVGQVVTQMFAEVGFLSVLLGFVGFVLALFLATRQEKWENAARINGGLRLGMWVLGFFFNVLTRR